MKTTPFACSRSSRAALMAALASLPVGGLLAQSTFNASVSGQQWGTAANWSAGVPNAAGAVATLAANGGVANLSITNAGLGYVSAPAVTFNAGGMVATANLQNRVAIVNVTNGGSGYTTAPTVVFSGGGATVNASGVAAIDAVTGKVTGVTVQIQGYGFTSVPTVTLTGGGGSGATAEAHTALGVVGFNISAPGVYAAVPTVAMAAPTAGTVATATSTLAAGGVSGVVIGAGGAGFVAPPSVTFAAAPADGTRATGYAVVTGGAVTSIVVTHPGSGYLVAPAVTLSGPTATATAAASLAPVPFLDSVGGTYPYTVGALNVTYGVGSSIGKADTADDVLRLEQTAGVPAINVSLAGGSLFFYGSLAGNQGFDKTGPGTLTFRFNNAPNSISGPIGILGGTLGIQSDGTLGAPENDLTIAGGATLLAQPSTNAAITLDAGRSIVLSGPTASSIGNASPYTGPLTINTAISGAGGLTKTGAGPLILTSDNTYAGVTTVSAGLLVATKPGTLPGYQDPELSGGELPVRVAVASGAALTVRMGGVGEWSPTQFDDLLNNASIQPTGSTFVGIDTTNATGPVQIDGLLTSLVTVPGYGFAKTGPGILELTGVNGYTGQTGIFQGTLRPTTAGAIPSASTLNFTGSGGTLDLGSLNQTIAGMQLNAPGVILGTGGLTLQALADVNVAGTVTGTNLDLTGLTNFTFTGLTRAFGVNATGANVVNTVLLAKSGINQFDAAHVRFGGGGGNFAGQNTVVGLGQTNNINVSGEFVVGNFQGSGNVSFQPGLTNPTLTVRGPGGTGSAARVSVPAVNSGNQSGTGILNTTGGTVDIQATKFYIARHFANAGGTSSTGTFTFDAGTITADTLSIAAKSTNDNTPPVASTGAPTLNGTINQNGGTFTATTVNLGFNANAESPRLTANYNLNAGELRATTITGSGATFAANSLRNLTLNGGTLRNIAGSSLTVAGVDATAQGTINLILGASGGTFHADSATVGNVTLGANTTLTGAGGLTKLGAGTLTIPNPAYAGSTTVTAGKVALGAANANNDASSVSIATGAVLELNFAGTDTVDKLFLNGVQQAAGTYTSAHASGAFAGTGSLVVTTSGAPLLTALEEWRFDKFADAANSGAGADLADPDNDGRPNLLEYATGTEPLSANAGSAVTLDQAGGKLTLTFNRVADPALTYTVRALNDLGTPWTSATSVFSSTGVANTAGLVTAEDTVLINAQPRRFLRLEVSY